MFKYLEAIEELPQDIKKPFLKVLEIFREEVLDTVRRTDFDRFEKATEENFSKVWKSIEELAEAQKRTEQRVEELAEAQKRTEQRVEELAEAQKRTEQRVEELAEAQKETQKGLTALTEDVRKLTADVKALTRSHRDLKELVGGLSHTVGYRLEDESYKALPMILKQDMGIEVIGRLKRDFVEIAKGRYIEVNIWGEARCNGKNYLVVGEAKTQLKRRDIDDFIKRSDELKKYFPKEQIRILVTYQASPQVQEYAKTKGIRIFFSYEF